MVDGPSTGFTLDAPYQQARRWISRPSSKSSLRRRLIRSYEVACTTDTYWLIPNIEFYASGGQPSFDWVGWAQELDKLQEVDLREPEAYGGIKFDIYDLIVIRCLELDARMEFTDIDKEMARLLKVEGYKRLISLASRRFNDSIIPQGIIRGYRAYLVPGVDVSLLFLLL